MSANLYFLIKKNSSDSVNIINGPDYLPITFYNVSNFNNLEINNPDLIKDLTWIGKPELGFWQAIIDIKPDSVFNKKIISENIINKINQTINVIYKQIDLTLEEQEQKKILFKKKYSTIRDSYLKLTDFTQLPDAPLSDQVKQDYSIFRQELRTMFDKDDYSSIVWPSIPTSASNIQLPPFPILSFSDL